MLNAGCILLRIITAICKSIRMLCRNYTVCDDHILKIIHQSICHSKVCLCLNNKHLYSFVYTTQINTNHSVHLSREAHNAGIDTSFCIMCAPGVLYTTQTVNKCPNNYTYVMYKSQFAFQWQSYSLTEYDYCQLPVFVFGYSQIW